MIRSNRATAVPGFRRHHVSNDSAAYARIIRDGDIGRTRKRTSATAAEARAGVNRNRIYAHSAAGWIGTRVIGSAPLQLRILAIRRWRQIDGGGNKAAGVSGPCLASCQYAIRDTDGAVIAAFDKSAARGKDVDERSAIHADLKHTAIEAGFSVVAVSKRQPDCRIRTRHRRVRNSDNRRGQTVLCRSHRTDAASGIGRGFIGGGRTPRCGSTCLCRGPTSGKGRGRHAVEVFGERWRGIDEQSERIGDADVTKIQVTVLEGESQRDSAAAGAVI